MNLIDHNVGHAGGEWREGEYGEDVRGEASHKRGKRYHGGLRRSKELIGFTDVEVSIGVWSVCV